MEALSVIKSIRESFGGSIAVYNFGNCYQLYEILKTIFPDAEAYDCGGHIWTKIGGEYYDIKGKQDPTNIKLIPVTDENRIKDFQVNKWTDERRKEYGMGPDFKKSSEQ